MQDVSKLPKWAQEIIQRQERKIAELEDKIERKWDSVERAKAWGWLDPYSDHPVPVANDSYGIRLLPPGTDPKDSLSGIDIRWDEHQDAFRLLAGYDLILLPRSSNVAMVQNSWVARQDRK